MTNWSASLLVRSKPIHRVFTGLLSVRSNPIHRVFTGLLSVRSNPIHRVFAVQPHECGYYERSLKQSNLVWMLAFQLLCMQACLADDLLGRAACATSTCHGGVIGQGPKWNHSLSTWIAKDPHAGAGLLLRDEDSR